MGGEVGQRAHWSLVLLSTLTYAAICATGVRYCLALAHGDDKFEVATYEGNRLWGVVLATLYTVESALAQFTDYTVFPRWQTIHLLKHHVPFTAFIFYSLLADALFGDVGVWSAFRWTNAAILMTQGNEACECFQTLGGERWLHDMLGIPLPPPTEDVPGLVEKARLTVATTGVTQVAIAETTNIAFAWYRAVTGTGHWYYALHSLLIVPAAQLHYKLVTKYWSRIARWQRAAWGVAGAGKRAE